MKSRSNMAALLQYTILFCILVCGIYGVFMLSHKSFIQGGDAIKQGYFWTVETKHQMEQLFGGNGLQLWSWSKLLGMSVQTNRYWDPFNWIAAAFPVGYIELGYTFSIVLRIYFGGLAFLALMRYTGASVFSSVFGAAAYAFSGYFIVTGLVHPDFLINIYLFPLLVLSVEMVYKGRSPAFFSLATALYIVSNFYHSYMAAVSIIPYIFLRYFAYRRFELKDYAKVIGKFILFGILGICIGGIQFIQDFTALSAASTESATDSFRLLFYKSFYINLSKILIGTGNVKRPEIIGWTLIVIMLVAVAIPRLKLKKTPAIMTLILFAGAMLPTVCSVYSFFGYPSLRWVFALELFAAWAAASELDEAEIFSRSGIGIAAAALGLSAILTLGMNYIYGLGYQPRSVAFLSIHLLGGLAFLTLLILVRKEGHLRRFSKIMILMIFSATMSLAWTVSFIDNKSEFYRNNSVNKMLASGTQRAGSLIEDKNFYRLDQVDTILFRNRSKLPPNETLWWQTRSIYGYNSRVPADLLEFNRLLGNNYGYSKRVSVVSNDNRTGLDYLYGVKYYLGDDLKENRSGADEYAGYGFGEYKTLDGVRVFRSKYDVSLGYVFDKYIYQSEFEKLGYPEREQALLQAVVMPDDAELPALQKADAADIKTAVKDISYTVSGSDGVTLTDDSIIVKKSGGSITIEPQDVENSQVLLSFTGLLRNVSEGQSESFMLYVENERIEGVADNTLSDQTIPNIKDYTFNLGYYDRYNGGKIKISFSASGIYSYDKITMTAMDADLFDDCINSLSKGRYRISSFSDTLVEGSADCEKEGILLLSITEPERWECFIDGVKAEIIKNADIAFMGVEIPSGHHDIRLRFRNRMAELGVIVSIIGLIVLIVASRICGKSDTSNH